jgi:hypothetical protein
VNSVTGTSTGAVLVQAKLNRFFSISAWVLINLLSIINNGVITDDKIKEEIEFA